MSRIKKDIITVSCGIQWLLTCICFFLICFAVSGWQGAIFCHLHCVPAVSSFFLIFFFVWFGVFMFVWGFFLVVLFSDFFVFERKNFSVVLLAGRGEIHVLELMSHTTKQILGKKTPIPFFK